MQRIARELGEILTAMVFLTRLPVPAGAAGGDLARAVRAFPLVGLLVGAIAAAVLLAASALAPLPVAAGLAIGAGILATGALHEDGLADCADGLGAGRDRERALEIMRDSRTGSYGALALVLSVGLRWAALAALAPEAGAVALLLAHSLSRAVIAPVPLIARYARPQGLGRALDGLRPADAGIAWLAALVVALLAGAAGLAAFLLAALAGGAVLALMVCRIGGWTGDGLGAIQQAAEIAVMLTLAGWWR